MSEDPQLLQPEAEAALAQLDAADGLPLEDRAAAFEAFHDALTTILDAEPAE
ncbi:hypothetical protein GCM10012320_34760 [Sinomonas cellulolyticus]|jgi:hypothetical protein|uniref:Uncharacterized protein n=1 Tax=Sinomonas cellulolyticus TaxID=2801916 RepID=A0ABS1JZX0_9MICC|nr:MULTISPECIES: hypothetical protein [Sinomonas]MBL0704946.1 hypothetical protein [Sinomonas cellulolyticus]GHG60211.1 hypothetical protein GCM10012320_34760 [Sinomonas sp. KCTC 49339]